TAVERDPGERPVLGITGAPLRYQGRLAKSGRGADEDELGIGAGQEGDEPGPVHPFGSRVRRVEFGLDRHVEAHPGTRHPWSGARAAAGPGSGPDAPPRRAYAGPAVRR